jgi:hypothetical protein
MEFFPKPFHTPIKKQNDFKTLEKNNYGNNSNLSSEIINLFIPNQEEQIDIPLNSWENADVLE